MKYIKMLGLLAVAAAALMAFAGSASATEATSPTGTQYAGEIHAVSIGEPPTLHGVATITCTESTASGKIESQGASVTAEGKLSALTFGGCTPNNHVTVTKLGKLIAHTDEEKGAGKYDATLTSSGTRVVIEVTSVGLTCEYETENTHIGTLTSSESTGGHAVLDIATAEIPRVGGSFFCGANGIWTGTYTVTTPAKLYID